jgi:hypothetical protein
VAAAAAFAAAHEQRAATVVEGAPTGAVQLVERSRAAVRITLLIAGAYRPFGQPCCETGERPASLGKADVSRATCSALGGPARDRLS